MNQHLARVVPVAAVAAVCLTTGRFSERVGALQAQAGHALSSSQVPVQAPVQIAASDNEREVDAQSADSTVRGDMLGHECSPSVNVTLTGTPSASEAAVSRHANPGPEASR